MVTVRPEEFSGAIDNPLKGFRGGSIRSGGYGKLVRSYVPWNKIEVNVDDSVERIIAHTNEITKGFAENNVKLVPRVFLDWDGEPRKQGDWPTKGQHWPRDLPTWDYDSEQFQSRLVRLVEKLGEAWDQDPRIFSVQMGLIGMWGEDHDPESTKAQRVALAQAFRDAFPNKTVCVRHPHATYMAAGFGIYYDTFAYPGREEGWSRWLIGNYPDQWRTAPIEGEVEYNWQKKDNDTEFFGTTPDQTMTSARFRRYMIGKIRQYHANHLGWIATYSHGDKDVLAGAAEIQKAFGYRFLIDEFSYTPRVDPGGELAVSFKVRNTGSAPLYLDWPVSLALLDSETRQPVWQAVLKTAKPREWMPGSRWDEESFEYREPAETFVVNERVTLPGDLAEGTYVVAIAILDRQGGMVPSARFAIRNYYTGGYHPLSRVGVGVEPGETALDPSTFDSPAFDETLHYIVPHRLLNIAAPPEPTGKRVKPWQPSAEEMIDPHRYWDMTSRGVESEKRVSFDGPNDAKVITVACTKTDTPVYYSYGKTHSLHYGFFGVEWEQGATYRLTFKAKGTPGYQAWFRPAERWQGVAESVTLDLSQQWQAHSIEFVPDRDCTDPMLTFSLPQDRTGEFSICEPHLVQLSEDNQH